MSRTTALLTRNWNHSTFRLQLARIRQVFTILVFLTSLIGVPPQAAGAEVIKTDSTGLICEDFNALTPGGTIGTYAGWYDAGAGPVVTAGNG
ncbi:MAG TPA: hypothetical protein VK249_02505, partial [Anaerolineales bacterium]|nr:hypothetical protein [Anaerolineales bacterium]